MNVETKPKKGVTIAGREAYSLKGFEEFTTLIRTIASRRNISIPEALDEYALPAVRKAYAKVVKVGN